MNNRKFFIIIALFMTMAARCYGQNEEIMDRGIKQYLRGDYLGAIEDFERILEMGENEKAGKLLYKSYMEEGKRRFSGGSYEEAKKYLIRAGALNPSVSDREVTDLLDEIDKKLGVTKKAAPAAPEELEVLQTQIKREQSSRTEYKNKTDNLTYRNNQLDSELKASAVELKAAQEKISLLEKKSAISKKTGIVIICVIFVIALVLGIFLIITLRNLYNASSAGQYQIEELESKIMQRIKETDEESEALEERVARSINQMVDGQKTMVKQISQSTTGKTQDDIEQIKDNIEKHFDQQQDKLIELLSQQARALSSEKTEKVEVEGPSGRVITDINPYVRARADGVEMIPKTVSDPRVAEKMLQTYLNDPNNRVRGNACVAMHRYNPALAIETLNKMASSPDKWMRLTTAWAVGEIASPEVVPILRKLIDDMDERVKNRAIKAFESLAEVKHDVGEEIRKMIEESQKKDRGL